MATRSKGGLLLPVVVILAAVAVFGGSKVIEEAGVAFDRAWLDEGIPTHRTPDPDAGLKDVPNARQP